MRVHAFNPSSLEAEARHQESKVNQISLLKETNKCKHLKWAFYRTTKMALYLADSVNLCACVHAWHVYMHGVYEAYMCTHSF